MPLPRCFGVSQGANSLLKVPPSQRPSHRAGRAFLARPGLGETARLLRTNLSCNVRLKHETPLSARIPGEMLPLLSIRPLIETGVASPLHTRQLSISTGEPILSGAHLARVDSQAGQSGGRLLDLWQSLEDLRTFASTKHRHFRITSNLRTMNRLSPTKA